MHRIQRLGVGQMAKVLGVLYLLLGVIFAAVFAFVGSMVPGSMRGEDASMFGGAILIAVPFLYGVFGFIFGALIAALYNLVTGWTGGIEIDLEAATLD